MQIREFSEMGANKQENPGGCADPIGQTHRNVLCRVGQREDCRNPVYSTEIAIRNGAGSAMPDTKSMLFSSTSGNGLSQEVRNKVLLSASRIGFTDQATTVLSSSNCVPGLENQS